MDLEEFCNEAVVAYATRRQGQEDGITKFCRTCGTVKPLSEFYIRTNKRTADRYGRVSKCKECSKRAFQGWYRGLSPERLAEVRKEGRKASYLSRHKGRLSEEEAEALAENNLGICAICGSEGLVTVDHCHKTGAKRGLLCTNCNVMLGMAKDSIERLGKAIGYLYDYSNASDSKWWRQR